MLYKTATVCGSFKRRVVPGGAWNDSMETSAPSNLLPTAEELQARVRLVEKELITIRLDFHALMGHLSHRMSIIDNSFIWNSLMTLAKH